MLASLTPASRSFKIPMTCSSEIGCASCPGPRHGQSERQPGLRPRGNVESEGNLRARASEDRRQHCECFTRIQIYVTRLSDRETTTRLSWNPSRVSKCQQVPESRDGEERDGFEIVVRSENRLRPLILLDRWLTFLTFNGSRIWGRNGQSILQCS